MLEEKIAAAHSSQSEIPFCLTQDGFHSEISEDQYRIKMEKPEGRREKSERGDVCDLDTSGEDVCIVFLLRGQCVVFKVLVFVVKHFSSFSGLFGIDHRHMPLVNFIYTI